MIDLVDSVTASPPVLPPAPPERRDTPEASVQTSESQELQPQRPDPIALDVQRGEDGVFVYTLSDSATGRLVAVIPQGTAARTPGNYAAGGWVDLTA